MTTTLSFAVARRNEKLDTLTNNCNSGKLRIYQNGGANPANADAALGGATQLAELVMNATSFGAAAAGVLTANPITDDASADATGTAHFWRVYESDGTTVVVQGTCGTAGESMTLNTVSIVAGALVQCTAFTITFPA